MNFESALKYLDKFVSYEKRLNFKYDKENFNLERFKSFVKKSGIDYSKLKFIHTAGSKGKGSVCRILAEYLKKSGYKVGLFTSPHLVDIRERIIINGRMISKKCFSDYVSSFEKDIEDFEITYFEFLTAIALKYFIDEKVDYVVLETGLGGRLDSTNIVIPKLSILTRIEKEHVGILGNNLKEILNEKLGIVKKGVKVLIGNQSKYVTQLIREKLKNRGGKYFVEDDDTGFKDLELGSWRGFDDARIENAKTVFCALKILFKKVDKEIFKNVVRDTLLLGRFDVRKVRGKTVVFDVAHTNNSILNLIKGLEKFYKKDEKVFLISFMKGKDVKSILKKISKVAYKIIFTSSNNERGYSAYELAKILKSNLCEIVVEEDPYVAYRKALDDLKKNQILIVAGSHFLVGKFI